MKFIDEYRNKDLALVLAKKISETTAKFGMKAPLKTSFSGASKNRPDARRPADEIPSRTGCVREDCEFAGNEADGRLLEAPMTLMEVCGTHTMAIARFGIRNLLPPSIRLISGPGCPVCVTPNDYLDHAIALARNPDITICTFGDMMRVPGSTSSLENERAKGRDIRVAYSTLDALEIAKRAPDREVVFLGVGFETTAPTIAASIKMARADRLQNYSVLCANKTIPAALAALLGGPVKIDGFILPGHVSAIIGARAYAPVFRGGRAAGAIAGFEPTDILEAIYSLAGQITGEKENLRISYTRVVTEEGNKRALAVMEEIFEPCNAIWRGLGEIPGSGLKICAEFSNYDAATRFDCDIEPTIEPKGCRCGEILSGLALPRECPLFGKTCAPDNPAGACMVSSEGTCAAYYKYETIS